MSAPPPLLYRCTVCEADWTYEAVRHIACCRACGGSLVRSDAATVPVASVTPVPVPVSVSVPPVPVTPVPVPVSVSVPPVPVTPVPVPGRGVKRRGGRLASPLPAR